MIIDNLKNFSLYEKMDPLFKAAFDFLRSLEGRDLSEGKYSILNDEVYANLFSYDTMEPEKLKYEYHRKYADIHYIRKGEECIYWSRPGIQQPDDYNEELVGRTSGEQITIFKTVGSAVLDVVVATEIVKKAKENNLGKLIY